MAVRVVGFVFLALGIAFLILGINESGTFANKFMKEMAGTYSEETKWYIFGGIIMIVVGVGILTSRFFKRKT